MAACHYSPSVILWWIIGLLTNNICRYLQKAFSRLLDTRHKFRSYFNEGRNRCNFCEALPDRLFSAVRHTSIIKCGSFTNATSVFFFFSLSFSFPLPPLPRPSSPVLRCAPGCNWVIFSLFERCLRQAAVSRWPPAIVWASVFFCPAGSRT